MNGLVRTTVDFRPRSAGAPQPPLISRLRFQLPSGLVVALAAPLLATGRWTPAALAQPPLVEALVGAAIAIAVGYFMLRRLVAFPGIEAMSYALPCQMIGFGCVLGAFLLLDRDFDQLQFAASFAVASAWFLGLMIVSRRVAGPRIGVIPGGRAESVMALKGPIWSSIESPAAQAEAFSAIVADLRAEHDKDWERFIADAALAGVPVLNAAQVRESMTGKVEIEHLSENTLGSLNPDALHLKAAMAIDWITAAAALVLLSPLLVLVAAAVRLDSPGPALFTQRRVGYRGRIFTVYKFRTMHERSAGDEDRASAITAAGDDRVTRVGRVLRRWRIDELPQILNVLRGEMSWIGPRPEAVALSRWYENELPFYRYRHIVRPGITGWAQVNQGHVAGVDDVLEKLHYDFYYIKNLSVWLNILIVLKTIRTLLTGFGAK